MKALQGKIAVVTGAGSGIGRALALDFASRGVALSLCDHNPAALEETRRMLEHFPVKVFTQTIDVSKLQEMRDFVEETINCFDAVDIVVNNAGMTLMLNSIEKTDYADFERVLNVNFYGVLYGSREFLPYLRKRPEAALVNVASIFSTSAFPFQGPYTASKFAVRGLTEALRQEIKESNVAVSVVMPGGIKTNIIQNIEMENAAAKAKFARNFEKTAITSAKAAATQIVEGIRQKKRRILIGPDARIMDILVRLFPESYENIRKKIFK
jgi:short-subunit dehydrogenase